MIHDRFPKWNKTYIAGAVCTSGFLLGLVYVTPVRQASPGFFSQIWHNSISRVLLSFLQFSQIWLKTFVNFVIFFKFLGWIHDS